MEQSQNPETELSKYKYDIIGEVCNISMGAAATAFSNILGEKVLITSPKIVPATQEAIRKINQVPSLGIVINYTSGIKGVNLLVVKKEDVLKIVSKMMSEEIREEDFGEMHMSAIAEVMNQMMGSSATALAGFLGKDVNISPPEIFMITEENENETFDYLYRKINDQILVQFQFNVENMFNSQLINILSHEFSEALIETMMSKYGGGESEDSVNPGVAAAEIPPVSAEQAAAPAQPIQPQPAQPTPAVAQSAPGAQDTYREAAASYGGAAAAQAAYAPPREVKEVHPAMLPDFDNNLSAITNEPSNFDLIEDVPLEISVEIGRARRLVRDIIELSSGSIIELDKQAGDPVDVMVNGQLIARGEVVVIDESFGVRITDIADKKNTK